MAGGEWLRGEGTPADIGSMSDVLHNRAEGYVVRQPFSRSAAHPAEHDRCPHE